MRITGKLALSRLKVNRMNSFWAIAGIVLANALLVTVFSFIASGFTMINGTMAVASNSNEIASAYLSIIIAPAIFLVIIISVMTKVVISNVFKVSANQRIREFGVLKCTGATKKQIKSIVLYESILLSAVAIPIGAVVGILLSFIAINITNLFLDEINALTNVMLKEISFYLPYTFSVVAILVASFLCFIITLYSSNKPADKAAKTPAIDAIRGTGSVKIQKKKVHFSQMINKFFGFEGELANKNITRNRQNFKATFISLTVGVTLFVGLGGIISQANALMDFSSLSYEQSHIVDYTSSRTRQINEATGWEESIYAKPIDSDIGKEISKKLADFEGAEVFGIGRDSQTYRAILTDEFLTEDMKMLIKSGEIISEGTTLANYAFPASVETLDEKNYKKLCDAIGVPENSNILVNSLGYNDYGYEKYIVPYLESMKDVTLQKADGMTKTYRIDGMIYREDLPDQLDYLNDNPLIVVVPQAEVRAYSWYLTPANEKAFKEYATGLLEAYFPTNEGDEYMADGFSTRVYRTEEYSKVMNVAVVIFLILICSFSILLILIGFTNIASTLISNVYMRADEFAILQSLGMTKKGLEKMLIMESFLCSTKALILGNILGISITYLVNMSLRKAFPILPEFPFVSIVCSILIVLGITFGITKVAIKSLSRKNIIETIRNKGQR
ncbi:hypothetical protein AN643_04145 [Candidatus Epulonipiscioides saccharophilum]|nr:hypothetical protein AN643_04145 [Epulopiscium sp. SCG-B10WGA-EpuloB]